MPPNVFEYLCCACCDLFHLPDKVEPLPPCPKCGRSDKVSIIGNSYPKPAPVVPVPAKPVPEEKPEDNRSDPQRLADVIGNAAARDQLQIMLDASRELKEQFPHSVMTGCAGLGKTALANIIGRELGKPVVTHTGQSLHNPAKICDVLAGLKAGAILFVDEIHQLKKQNQEALYTAMEDGFIVPPTKGASAPIYLKKFTLIGATTDAYSLLPSLRRRFKFTVQLHRLSVPDLAAAIHERAGRLGLAITDGACEAISKMSLGRPGIAVNMLLMCRYYTVAKKLIAIDEDGVKGAAQAWNIDSLGLDHNATEYLKFLGDGAMKLNVLASRLDGMSRRNVETLVESDLLWLGFIEKRTDASRALTDAGRKYLGLPTMPAATIQAQPMQSAPRDTDSFRGDAYTFKSRPTTIASLVRDIGWLMESAGQSGVMMDMRQASGRRPSAIEPSRADKAAMLAELARDNPDEISGHVGFMAEVLHMIDTDCLKPSLAGKLSMVNVNLLLPGDTFELGDCSMQVTFKREDYYTTIQITDNSRPHAMAREYSIEQGVEIPFTNGSFERSTESMVTHGSLEIGV